MGLHWRLKWFDSYKLTNNWFLNPPSDSNYDQFHAALVDKEPKNLDIVLCYEQSTACVGVKRQSFEVGFEACMLLIVKIYTGNISNETWLLLWEVTSFDLCRRIPKPLLKKVTSPLYLKKTRKTYALLSLYVQAHLCAQEMSCESSFIILFATECVMAFCFSMSVIIKIEKYLTENLDCVLYPPCACVLNF